MSGLLSGILTAVAIVATVVSGGTLGIVAGALLAASFAANQGWLGKGAQKFAQSSTGKDLTMAVGLASAGLAVAGSMGAALPGTESAAVQSANAAAEGTSATTVNAAQGADLGANAAAATAPGANASTVSGLADSAPAITPSGTLAQTTSNANGIINSAIAGNPEVNLVQGSNTVGATADAQAVQTGSAGAGGLAVNASDQTEIQQVQQSLGINTQAQTQTANTAATQSAVNPSSGGLPTGDPGEAQLQAAAGAGPQPVAPASQGGPPSAASGLLSKAGAALSSPAGMIMGGNALSGLASGIANQKTIQEQIAAQQWGNMQWQQPGQVAQLQAAAAAPINVPAGYLNRAAAVRNLMNGSTSQTAPLQSSPTAAAPAPALPTPGAGLAGGSAQSPVPVAGMAATPRGGVI